MQNGWGKSGVIRSMFMDLFKAFAWVSSLWLNNTLRKICQNTSFLWPVFSCATAKSCHHIETGQLICRAKQLTDFYNMARFCHYTGKYGPGTTHLLVYSTQWIARLHDVDYNGLRNSVFTSSFQITSFNIFFKWFITH